MWSAEMALINRGRLSVQPVEEETFKVIQMLAEKGGWEESEVKKGKGAKGRQAKAAAGKDEPEDKDAGVEESVPTPAAGNKRKRKAESVVAESDAPLRRSTRARK